MGQLTIDEFRAKIDESQVTCQVQLPTRICGYKSHCLVKHLRTAHGMSSAQYKDKCGPTVQLASPIVSEVNRRLERKASFTDELEKHLKAFQFGDNTSNSLLEAGKAFPAEPAMTVHIPKLDQRFKMTEDTKYVAYAVAQERNLFIQGPTGSGKTQMVLQAHAVMKRPLKRINMQGDVTAKNFIGEAKANSQGTYFEYGVLPFCMMNGITLLADEIDFTPPHIGVVLHPVLEGERTLFIPYTGETVKAKPGFTVIATANTGGKGDAHGIYTGTEVLNTAFLDRFPLKINVGYLEATEEMEMLGDQFPKEKKELISLLVKIAGEIREAFMQNSLAITMSTRKLVDFFTFTISMKAKEAMNLTLLNWLDEDDRNTVKQIIDRCDGSNLLSK